MSYTPKRHLNEPGLTFYGSIQGTVVDVMKSVPAGRALVSLYGLACRRIESQRLCRDIFDDLWRRPYDTNDFVMVEPINGRVKFVLSAPRELVTPTAISDGAIVLNSDSYSRAAGLEISRFEAELLDRASINNQTVRDNPLVRKVMGYLFRGDEDLLRQYVSFIGGYKHNREGEEFFMGITLPEPQKVVIAQNLFMEGIANKSSVHPSNADPDADNNTFLTVPIDAFENPGEHRTNGIPLEQIVDSTVFKRQFPGLF